MSVPLLDLSQQHDQLRGEFHTQLDRLLDTGNFILGPAVDQFEQRLAGYCGVRHALGVSSGTDAILVALMAAGIGPGDEVITTPFTFFCTAGCVTRLGATPVFVDINPRTYNLQVEAIEGAITEKTKAIIPVHLYGLPADMDPIMRIARQHRLFVLEDAAQAIGARYHGRPVGGIGDAGILSFYPSKNLAALGDAGAVVTNDDDLAEKVRKLRIHGLDGDYRYPLVGGNFRIDALHAAMLSVKMPHLDEYTEARRRHAERYIRHFEELPLSTPLEVKRRHHVYNQFTVRVRSMGRDALKAHLDAIGIGSRVYYPIPLHLQPCYKHLGYERGSLPEAERAAEQVLSLPCYPEMTREQQDEVIQAVRDCFMGD